jgi:hypothetical protein
MCVHFHNLLINSIFFFLQIRLDRAVSGQRDFLLLQSLKKCEYQFLPNVAAIAYHAPSQSLNTEAIYLVLLFA